eukprot:gene1948-1456_t
MQRLEKEEWMDDFCDCTKDSAENCLKATLCSCCAAAEAKSRADGSNCYLWSLIQICFCPPLTTFYVHYKFRNTYNIQGNACTDCLGTLCAPCSQQEVI